MRLAVSDTGPLLHLYEISATARFAVFQEVHVTEKVLEELQRHTGPFSRSEWPDCIRLVNPSPGTLSRASEFAADCHLDPGEAEALGYAIVLGADVFLSDDADARQAAASVGIANRGSLGIILYAAAEGFITRSEASRLIDALEAHSTLWLTERVLNAARSALAQHFEDLE